MAKSRSIPVARWIWSDRRGPARLARELSARGLSRFHMPDAARSANLRSLFARLFGAERGLVRAARLVVKPRAGMTAVVGSAADARPHIDDDELMPANVQILCCVRPSRRGGDSIYVDSWHVLEQIERHDRSLFKALFEVPRVFHYVDMTPVRPTFSVRYDNLVFSHSAEPSTHDEIDRRLADWIERSPRYEFRQEPGDVCVINNQRVMHGRRAFRGSRQLVRFHYWFAAPLPSHPRYLARAKRFARTLARHNATGPTWAREWLQPSERSARGIARVSAILAYLAGEDPAAQARRVGASAAELERWTARVLSVAASTLGELDAEGPASRAVLHRQVLAAIDGLVDDARPRRR